jgi:hypothetical protein
MYNYFFNPKITNENIENLKTDKNNVKIEIKAIK